MTSPNLPIPPPDTSLEASLESLPPGPTLLGHAFMLLRLQLGEEAASLLLDLLRFRVLTCVLDTNVLLNDLQFAVRRDRTTALTVAAKLGGVRFFASTTVLREMYEKLKWFPDQLGFDPEEALRRWERDYVPWITFLDPAELPLLSPNVEALALRDRDDVPTGQIIEMLQPHAVLSADAKHLGSFNVIGAEWSMVTVAYRDRSREKLGGAYLVLGGSTAIWIGSGTLQALTSLLSRLDWRVLAGGGVALLLAVAHPRSRGWLVDHARVLHSIDWTGTMASVRAFVATVLEAASEHSAANLELARRERPPTPPSRARGYLVSALSSALTPLSAAEITRRMIDAGYNPRGARPDLYVAKLLRQHPLLFEREYGLWRLRSHAPDATHEKLGLTPASRTGDPLSLLSTQV